MYLRLCLAHSAGLTPALESVEAMREQAPLLSAHVRSLLQREPGDKGPIATYINIAKQLLNAIPGAYDNDGKKVLSTMLSKAANVF